MRREVPAHHATGPQQVWSCNITYRKTPVRGIFWYLYLILDIWSRRIMGWAVHPTQRDAHAATLFTRVRQDHAVPATGLVQHADNGGPMKGATMLATLERLGVVPSFSRPRVSDGNPYSEALFRTLKYCPAFPTQPFATVDDARAWVTAFVTWYNHDHHHSAIQCVAPDDRHTGNDGVRERRTGRDRRRRRGMERHTTTTLTLTAVASPSANCMRPSTRIKFFLAALLKALKLDMRAAYRTAQQAFAIPAVPAESEDERIKRFLTDFFRSAPTATVLQIGANDGVMNDPLRPFLPTHQGKIVLVEALPHYCASLRQLYRDQKNVNVAALLVASREEERDFYYIRPAVADLMDGDGPPNRWAHGQGSFRKSTVVDWIVKNQFRGQAYRQNLPMFIDAIECCRLTSVTLSSLTNTYQLGQIDLVVLDVQGAEYEVLSSLKGIEKFPRFIIYEDDSSLSDQDRSGLESMLSTMGYVFIAGKSDRLWGLDLVRFPRSGDFPTKRTI